jgi:hypothetical protein
MDQQQPLTADKQDGPRNGTRGWREMTEGAEDQELAAIKTLLGALKDLKPESRDNVLGYVFRRLGIAAPIAAHAVQPAFVPLSAAADPAPAAVASPPPAVPADLRSLTDQKLPKSANQMVAVLAYYLANLAPGDERRDYIVSDDIKKYFPQANFELPAGNSQTLVNAKNAGYLDTVAAGKYRLNPVGHNLVTHRLPHGEGSAPNRRVRRVKKVANKRTTKKKAAT